jgi:hypothetical protein
MCVNETPNITQARSGGPMLIGIEEWYPGTSGLRSSRGDNFRVWCGGREQFEDEARELAMFFYTTLRTAEERTL